MPVRVFCDFDGTISTVDTTDRVLSCLGNPDWEGLESDWLAGRIDAAQCMREQVALIGGTDAELNAVLDAVELDPGFCAFAAWCGAHDIPLTIVSDGVDYFIRRILAAHGLGDLPVISNRLAGAPGQRVLEQPFAREGCAARAGVCKCEAAAIAAPGRSRRLVYVGDGRSDFCVSARADVLFAKGALAEHATARGQAHHVYATFDDVTAALQATLIDRAAS